MKVCEGEADTLLSARPSNTSRLFTPYSGIDSTVTCSSNVHRPLWSTPSLTSANIPPPGSPAAILSEVHASRGRLNSVTCEEEKHLLCT